MDVAEIIGSLDEGRFATELENSLKQAVATSAKTGKPATITFKMTVDAAGQEQAVIDVSLESKLPQRTRAASIFFVDMQGELTKQNPRQMELPLLRKVE